MLRIMRRVHFLAGHECCVEQRGMKRGRAGEMKGESDGKDGGDDGWHKAPG